MMTITKTSAVAFIAIALSLIASSEAKVPFSCARARNERACGRPKFKVKGCFWCDNKCGHYTECDSAQPECTSLQARKGKQKLICKAQGCDVVGKKCVPKTDTDEEATPAPTTCKHPIRVIKGQVDKSGYCTKGCPCDEFEGDCDDDSQCKGDLKCIKASGAEFDLDEDFDVCLSAKNTKKPTAAPTPVDIDEKTKLLEGKFFSRKDLPSLEEAQKNPDLLLKLPEDALKQLGDLEDQVKKDASSIKLGSADRFKFATRTPAMWEKANEDISKITAALPSLCIRKVSRGKLGYCQTSDACKCDEGEGWCRSNDECKEGLVCEKKRGKYYGYASSVAVCVREAGRPELWEDSGKFEGDIDIETTHTGINLVATHYGVEHAQSVVNAFPKSYFEGAMVKPDLGIARPTSAPSAKPPIIVTIPDITLKTRAPTNSKIVDPTSPPSALPSLVINPEIVIPPVPDHPKIIDPAFDPQKLGGLRGGRQLMNKRKLGATDENILWPNGIMYYTIASSVSDNVKKVIEDAMDHWKSKTCIRFVKRTSQKDYVNFIEPSKAVCSSAIGRDGGKQTIKLHSACGFGAAVHEIMHALGFFHEQSRPDRNSFVNIHWDNIKDGKKHNFDRELDIESHGSRYDYGSIMHYSSHAFSKNGKATITPKVEGAVLGQRNGLSDHDIWQAKKLYNCLDTCPNGHYKKTAYYGTAPFCNGQCPSKWREIGRHRSGGGATCWTGSKAHCATCCKRVTATVYKWFGTAPFCDGECPSGWTYVKRSKTGGGARCWTGWKRQCKKVTTVEQCQKPALDFDPNCPPGGNRYDWFGSAPFCGSPSCPSGWTSTKTSKYGDGHKCWTGYKRQCRRSC